MGKIEFDFNMAIRQANRLSEIAADIEKLSDKKIASTMRDVSYNWTGTNAGQFIAKGNAVKSAVNITAGNLEKTALNIKTIARQIYQTELRAKEIADKRTAR